MPHLPPAKALEAAARRKPRPEHEHAGQHPIAAVGPRNHRAVLLAPDASPPSREEE
jgi:hypothetical protein